jgi:hypothetical protein
MALPGPIRRFVRGHRGLLEAYAACWHGRGVFQSMARVRVNRYRDRWEIVGDILDLNEDADWRPTQTNHRLLTPAEGGQVRGWVEAASFWSLPERDEAGCVLDGDCWTIQGYRAGEFHTVYRHLGSLVDGTGAEVYRLGRQLAALAGLPRFAELLEE